MPASTISPTDPRQRLSSLDSLRGLALFGVLMVNLQALFRVSLFDYCGRHDVGRGYANIVTDYAIRFLLEFKAFAIFNFLFGVGMAAFFERARHPGHERPLRLLLRRLSVLGAIGALHLLFWNGDVLFTYALAGTLVCPLLLVGRRLVGVLALGCGVIGLAPLPLPGLPDPAAMLRQAAAATAVYGRGDIVEMFRFRWDETRLYIAPLLLGALPRIVGLLLAGIAAWRSGLLTELGRFRRLHAVVAAVGIGVGAAASALRLLELASQVHLGALSEIVSSLSVVPFALGWTALLLWASADERWLRHLSFFAPAGRMALTNYLMQSIAFSFVFYGYGLGLIGRLPSAPVALGGVAFYALQVLGSRRWLSRFRFGPFEWAWRALTFSGPVGRRAVG
jgi:uncharacterized protein